MINNKWYGITIILSACSIIYELLLATSLSQMTGSYVWWHSWTISFYILGLGIGSYLANKKEGYGSFIKIEISLSLLGIFSLIIIQVLHGYLFTLDMNSFASDSLGYEDFNFKLKLIFFIVSQGFVVLIGTMSGYEIPLIIKMNEKDGFLNEEHKIIAYNYLGTLVGTLFFTFVLHPHLELTTVGIIIGLFNLGICACFFFLNKEKLKAVLSLILIIPVLIPVFLAMPKLEQTYQKIRYFYGQYVFIYPDKDLKTYMQEQKDYPYIRRVPSLYQNIDIFNSFQNKDDLNMFLDGHFQFSTLTERFYHEGFSHIPLLLTKTAPKRVLVLGAGDGMLIRELLKHDHIESILHIELDGTVYEMFKDGELSHLNDNSLNHQKVKTIVGDGFYFVRNTKEKFDGIFIDFPYPKSYDLSRLYSIEFYKNIYRILNDNGLAVLDAPLSDRTEKKKGNLRDMGINEIQINEEVYENNSVILSTLYYSGFQTIYPYRVTDESFVVVRKEKHNMNFEVSEDFFSLAPNLKPEIISDLKTQNIPYQIDKKHINSIFFPKLVDKWTLAPTGWYD